MWLSSALYFKLRKSQPSIPQNERHVITTGAQQHLYFHSDFQGKILACITYFLHFKNFLEVFSYFSSKLVV